MQPNCFSMISLIQHWEEMRTSTEERDQLAAHVNQVLSPKIKRHQMCLAERAMAAEHASAIVEERKKLLTELEQGNELWIGDFLRVADRSSVL